MMKVNKDLMALYNAYVGEVGVVRQEVAGYLVVSHCVLELKEAILPGENDLRMIDVPPWIKEKLDTGENIKDVVKEIIRTGKLPGGKDGKTEIPVGEQALPKT